jgi:7-cyano-7-deazaguanine synthase
MTFQAPISKIDGTAYVLLSGGIDSSTCLAYALAVYSKVHALTINYGQRHAKEIEHAASIARFFDTPITPIRLHAGKGGLTDPNQQIPTVDYSQLEGVSPSYVPFRNGYMLSAVTSHAQADPEAVAVLYGAHAEDAANWAYPDCTPEFIGAMANAIYVGTYHRIRLVTPIMWSSKADVVRLGHSLGVPFELTWSCYEGGAKHCGVCPTCRARKRAFIDAKVYDHTKYVA